MQTTNKKLTVVRVPNISLTLPATVGSVPRATKGNRRPKNRKTAVTVQPAAFGSRPLVGRPNIKQSMASDGRIRVRHREFVTDVNAITAFTVRSLPINPGQSQTFPWLSALAVGFESYVFKTLCFEYLPSVGTSTAGSVLLAVDYDASDPTPATKAEFMQTHGAVRVSPWDQTACRCDAPDLTKLPQRYTRKTPWAGSGDLKTYDVGQFMYATSGIGTGTQAGEIYVSYDVELITPQPTIYLPSSYAAFVQSAGVLTPGRPFGSAGSVNANSSLSFDPTNGRITFKDIGRFLISNVFTGTAMNVGTGLIWNASDPLAVEVADVGTVKEVGALSSAATIRVNSLPAYLSPQLDGPTAVAAAFARLAAWTS